MQLVQRLRRQQVQSLLQKQQQVLQQQALQERLRQAQALRQAQQLLLSCCKRSAQQRPAGKRSGLFFSWKFLQWLFIVR